MKRNNLEEQFLKQGFKAIVLFLEGKDINSKVSMLTISRLITKWTKLWHQTAQAVSTRGAFPHSTFQAYLDSPTHCSFYYTALSQLFNGKDEPETASLFPQPQETIKKTP